jgi:ribonuclease J
VIQNNKKNSLELTKKLKEYVESNNKIHINRLNPHYKLDLDTKTKLRFTPLGGLGEIGGNMAVLETEKEAIIIDVGMSFPDENMHGVDILVPDFGYLKSIKHKIKAIIITHAHEDHIGAVPYLFKELQFPLYGTSLALQMIASKFDEHRLSKFNNMLHPIEKRKIIEIGEFKIEWIHITHSIIDCSSLAITTEAGTIIHTGDFKIDHTPVDNFPTDLHRFAHYGERGVLLLLSDSTNSYKEEPTKSEKTIGPTFDKIFAESKGRIFMSTFSSNAHRIYQAMERAIATGRHVCIVGRSMDKNVNIAIDLGYLKLPRHLIVGIEEVNRIDDDKILIVTTGSQGEPMSALYRISVGEHKQIRLKPEDTVIISANAIPGNEAGVSGLINNILKCGAKAIYKDYGHIHVSGHASAPEQKLMLRLCKPKFFLPVHGEYNHVLKHARTAMDCGVLEKNILLMEDGATIEIHPRYMKKVTTVKSGKTYIDNQRNRRISHSVVNERQILATDGIISVIVHIDRQEKVILSAPKISTYGVSSNYETQALIKDFDNMIDAYIKQSSELKPNKTIESDIRNLVKKHIVRLYRKYPIIEITVIS